MDFGGELSIVDPSTIFQIFNMSRLTGELKFIRHDNVASFFFKEGELIYATVDTRSKKIGQFLIEEGHITQQQLDEILHEYLSQDSKQRIGNLLIKHGYLDYDTLVDTIQEQMKEVVYDVLSWQEGRFVFFNNILPSDEDILLDIKLDHLILEGLKRLDETARDEK
ncbi:MAG: hypothetical protein B6D63_02510 [Candidatus Latescibacteria bacterium 4484_7]|nr:MAG: hypothetical protein B6D63_02510 [Candidatus Latescibacteria bacterium 4484_7]